MLKKNNNNKTNKQKKNKTKKTCLQIRGLILDMIFIKTILRMFVLIKSTSGLELGHMVQKSRPLDQILK